MDSTLLGTDILNEWTFGKKATTQLAHFQTFCAATLILPVTDDVLGRAAELWAHGRQTGFAPNDADLMIAATAALQGRALITGNTSHFA